MPSEREKRIALNEALFRTANERAAAWEERHEEGAEVELYQCECADLHCREKVPLGKPEYERVRQDPTLFFVVPGHEIPEVETVVEEHEGWAVVRKAPETHAIVKATDERSS